jgi:hypothetical protein
MDYNIVKAIKGWDSRECGAKFTEMKNFGGLIKGILPPPSHCDELAQNDK